MSEVIVYVIGLHNSHFNRSLGRSSNSVSNVNGWSATGCDMHNRQYWYVWGEGTISGGLTSSSGS